MINRLKNYVRRRVRATQRGGQFPLLLPHHRVDEAVLRSVDGSAHPLPARLAAALESCDGRRTLAAVAREAGVSRADLIRAHDDGLLLFWPEPLPEPPAPTVPHALHAIILSPHPDDAALSCGGRMLGDRATLVVNVFTRTAWWRFPFDPAADAGRIQACRSTEEQLVSRLSGCPMVALDLPEALLRGRAMEDVFTAEADDRDAAAGRSVRDAVSRLAREHPLAHWYLPLGVGHHIDHRLARDAALAALREQDVPTTHVHFYEDLPYAAKLGPGTDFSRHLTGLELGEEVHEIDDRAPWKFELLRAYWSQFRWSDLAETRAYTRAVGNAEITWTAV